MASIQCGQSTVLPFPQRASKLTSLTDTTIAPSLQVEQNAIREEGMLVYKVNKNGKLQARRLTISPDHRTLWITTHKVKGLLTAATSSAMTKQASHLQCIDVHRMDHVLKGQISKRFALAKHNNNYHNDNHSDDTNDAKYSTNDGGLNLTGGVETAEELSLTLFYHDCSDDRSSWLFGGNNGNSNSNSGSSSTNHASGNSTKHGSGEDPLDRYRINHLETLDLIVPSSQHFQDLWNGLQDMLRIYKKIQAETDRTTLLLQYLWIDIGKFLDEGLSHGEWLALLERLHSSLKKSVASSLYKEVHKQLRKSKSNLIKGGGLPLWAVTELLNDVRFHYTESKPSSCDPMLRLWNELLTTDPVPALKSGQQVPTQSGDTNAEETKKYHPSELIQSISSVALLSFIRTRQKEYKTTLEDAVDKIHVLNGMYSSNKKETEENHTNSQSVNRLTKTKFFQFLLSDANDILDPEKGKLGSDDMTHPLSHYWICSSHDTYLNHYKNHHGQIVEYFNEHMYLAALYRGVRCLEMDVWDRNDEPVICREQPRTGEEPFLAVEKVLSVIRQFLLANPKCYPVILNIENHCSYKNQERLASHLFRILGRSGLIVVPDDTASIDEGDLLPSPHAMRGKVLIMGKRPKLIADGAKVINDDFDDENDQYDADGLPNVLSREEEEAELDQGIVIGFDSAGPIKATKKHENNIVQHSAGELLFMATQDLEEAKMEAAQAEMKALNLSEEADRAEKTADDLMEQAGLSKDAVNELANQVKGVDIDPSEHVGLLARAQGEGVEVQEFFADGVEAARATFTEAEQEAIEAASNATECLQRLNHATAKLRDAEALLEKSYSVERSQVAEYQRAATEARANREDADYAKKRVEKVHKLLEECEESANSAENVVVTAMTEAKISEKRASETEARAARAATKAKDDRRRADEETKKEENLEKEASMVHERLSEAISRTSEAQTRAENSANMIDRINEQLRYIELSTQYARELQEQSTGIGEEKKDSGNGKNGKLLAKHAAKVEERRVQTAAMKKAQAEQAELEQRQQQLKHSFENTAHLWKKQTETASKLRKVADKSATTAEELAEHAEEEREAANLRHIAREKAKSNVSEKDSYRKSLQAQVKEAERVAKELEMKAQQARSKADALDYVHDELPTHDKNIRHVERRKAARNQVLEEYHRKKMTKEEAEDRAAEAKRVFETSENVYSQAMRNAAKEDRKADYQRQADRNALVAFNHARLLRKQAEHAMEDARYAQSTVTERQVIIKRATEYREKMARITPIPTSLAKMTFLHTTKHRHWDKSFDLPNTHVHSFAQGVLDKMKENDPHNHDRLKEFTTEHVCRTFPSWKDMKGREKINSEPLFLWALGCQLVSLNYGTFDEHVLKADGRFRRNGSSGYVLKPENLTHGDSLKERQETWSIDVLCGSCLPSPEINKKSEINPFVKVVVYGGDIEGKKAEHRTKAVLKNGINPIWDEKSGITFTSHNPSLSLCVFTVWHKGEHGEEFIAGAALPVSAMREGFRSVALFDAYHRRSGPYAFASLLVKAMKATK